MFLLSNEDVNKAIKTYFKDMKEWTVVNGGDYKEYDIKKEDEKVDD